MKLISRATGPTEDPRRRRLLDTLTAQLGLDAALMSRAEHLAARR